MADPVYDDDGIDRITLTFAVVLAAAIVLSAASTVEKDPVRLRDAALAAPAL